MTEKDKHNSIILKILDNNYNNIATFQANNSNEVKIVATHFNIENERNSKNNIMAIQNFRNAEELIWHRRLGHFYQEDLKNFLNHHEINLDKCDDCRIAKMKRNPHNKIPPRAKEILEVIHSDIIGPINTSYTGKRFILTILDEVSRKSWVFIMKSKSEATDIIINTLRMLNNKYKDYKIKVFKSDNAKEYKNKKIDYFCNENGIEKVFSPPYNPENNGLCERFNLTIVSCAKTLLYWSGLSENFWDFAILYANYIYNKVPHSGIHNKIPDEIFYMNKVKINHIKVFGCISFYIDRSQNKSKFSPNSKKGIFLGFSEKSNSYIIMDFHDYSIHYCREIYCLEDTPANIKLANNKINQYGDQDFLAFDFYFSKNSPQFSGEDNLDHSHHNDKSSENKYNGNFKKNNKNLGPSSKKLPTGLNEQIHKNSNNEHLPKKDKGKSPTTEDQNDTNFSNNIGKDIPTKIQEEEDQNVKNQDNFKNSSDENFSDNKNFSKNEENSINKDKNLNETLSNNNFNHEKNFSGNSNNNKVRISKTQNNNEIFDEEKFFDINDETLINMKFNNQEKVNEQTNMSSNKSNINIDNFNKNFSETNIKNNISTSTTNNILQSKNLSNSNYYNFPSSSQGNTMFNRNNIISSYIDKKFPFNGRRSVKELHIDNQNSFNTNPFNRINLPHHRSNFHFKNNKNFENGNIDYLFSNNQYKIRKNNFLHDNNHFNFNFHKRSLSDDLTPSQSQKFRRSNFNSKIIASLENFVPQSFFQATNCKDHVLWEKAIDNELDNLYTNKIMTFVNTIPDGKKPIPSKWVYALKTDGLGHVIKHKARFVAKGFIQKYGIDYEMTFSPTLNIDCLKLLIALAAKFKWDILQLDIKAAYLNANLDKDIYVKIPPGDPNFGRGYWKLNKALYGLKQSGRQWYKTISKFLIEQGMEQLKSESCVFKKVINRKLVCIIGLYVDDMIVTGEKEEINKIFNKIKNKFKISKSGPIDYLLGIKVENNNKTYSLSQTQFINNILKKFNINNQRVRRTPCVGDNTKSENNQPFDKTKYKSAIGMLIYLSKCTRPDIAFSVNKAARNSENPTVSDWRKVIAILQYLKDTKNYKIKYDGTGNIVGYTDSDFAGDVTDRKSTSGNIILMGNNPISWTSKKQSVVATSTAEAEYISASVCIKKLLRIKNILYELFKFNKPLTLFTDNNASKISMENGELNPKLKHISIKYHFNKDNIEKNLIKLKYISTDKMLADTLTKCVNGTKMTTFANQIFITNEN